MARMGFDSPNFGEAGKEYDSTHIGGYGNRTDGTRTANGALVPVGSGRQDEVDRYRSMAEAAAARQAYKVNFDKALGDEGRGILDRNAQLDATHGLREAARGNAPSQAAILGNASAGQSLEAQMAASANGRGGVMVKGGIGQAAAQQQAALGAMNMQQANLGQFTGMRGAEMAHAQQSYGQAGGALRTGDYTQQGLAQQRAEAQAQSEAAQRQLNQTGQMGYEQMGWNVNNDELNRNMRQKALYAGQYATDSAMQEQNNKQTDQAVGAFTSSVGSGVSALSDAGNTGGNKPAPGAATGSGGYDPYSAQVSASDESAKQRVVPLFEDEKTGERHWDRDVSRAPDVMSGASLSGPAPRYSHAAAAPKPSMGAVAAKAPRKLTDAELKRIGEHMHDMQKAEHEAQLRAGSAVAPPVDDRDVAAIRADGPEPPVNERDVSLIRGVDPNAEAKARRSLHRAMEEGGEGADPYANPAVHDPRAYEAGPQAAPAGLFESRRGQVGDVTGGGPRASYDLGFGAGPSGASRSSAAPGTNDFAQYGEPVDRNVMLSDDRTKLAAAWDEGHRAAVEDIGKVAKMDPAALKQRTEPVAQAVRGVKADAWDEGHRGAPPKAEGEMGRALEQGFQPFEYEYKPGFSQQEGQAPGEKNVGPMAQNMAQNPVTGSAVKKRDDGLLVVDIPKLTKTNSAGIGYLAAQQRQQAEEIERLKRMGAMSESDRAKGAR